MRTRIRKLICFYVNIVFTLLVVFATGVFGSQADAATYYISPSGSDSNSGTSISPWKTFGFAAPKLRPGDTLFLKDGTYGPISINCGSGAFNGTASQPITIKGQNERQAHIKAPANGMGGFLGVFQIDNCSNLVIEGLHVEGGENIINPSDGALIDIRSSNNITIKRNLVQKTSRYSNDSHGISLYQTTDTLIEDNEVYYHHRWAIIFINTNPAQGNNIARRNYSNRRGYTTAVTTASYSTQGSYPSQNNIFDNNIAEGGNGAFVAQSTGTSSSSGNKFYGNISINNNYSFETPISTSCEPPPSGNLIFENNVAIGTGAGGYGVNIINRQFSSFNSNGPGVNVKKFDPCQPSITASYSCVNCLVIGAPTGFFVNTSQVPNFTFDFPAVFGNGTDFIPETSTRITSIVKLATVANSFPLQNEMESCRVFVPASATSLKGKGKNDADIGANILYRYQSTIANPGNLTTQPLWNPITGEFPGGAIVPGVNDIAGLSRFDVHKRLNVNTNGCSFPAGYGGSIVSSSPPIVRPSSPVNLTAGR